MCDPRVIPGLDNALDRSRHIKVPTMPRNDAELSRQILENLRAYAIVVLDRSGVVTHWMGGASEITGFEAKELVGSDLSRLYTQADRAGDAHGKEVTQALRDGRAEDSRWHCRKDGSLFWANGLTVRLEGPSATLVKIFRDETPAKEAEEQRVLLLNELNHRVKNTLATVQSVTDQTLRAAGVSGDIRNDLANRLIALSRSHNVLVDQNWAGADLQVLIRDGLCPHDRQPSPFVVRGPAVRLHPSQAVPLSLALHELVTNALKYGALTLASGRVELSWNLAHDSQGVRYLSFLWRERGGPEVAEPRRCGFGSKLLSRASGRGASEMSELTFDPDGVQFVLRLRLIDDLPTGTEPMR